MWIFYVPENFHSGRSDCFEILLSTENNLLSYLFTRLTPRPPADVPPLFAKRGEEHRRCVGVSLDIGTNKNATLFHFYYL